MQINRLVAAIAAFIPTLVYADNSLHVGTPLLDRPTLISIGIKLPVTGDDNYNSRVSVLYRKAGETSWKTGLPLFRVHPDTTLPYVIAPQFAGSILDLRPATTYEIQLHVTDPDGPVDQTLSLTATTRAVPADPVNPHVVNVASADALRQALLAAQPGDVITLANGLYSGTFQLDQTGTANQPIVIRGASQDGVIVDGGGCDACNVFDLYGSYIHLERMTLQNAERAVRFQTAGAQGNVVRRVHTRNTKLGIGSRHDQLDSYIADNIVEGRLTWPSIYTDDDGLHADDDGIHVEGFGHVVAHNRISGFGDAMKTAQDGARSVDLYGNDILWSYDNGVELDGSEGNARLMRNRFSNTYETISGQPILGGPAYIYRNVSLNTVLEQLKLHSHGNPTTEPNGALIYHNTFVSPNYALTLQTPTSVHHFAIENNLFIGPANTVEDMSVDWYAFIDDGLFDYNGYWPDKYFAYNYQSGRLKVWGFAALQQAGLEKHGVMLNPQTLASGMVGPSTYTNLQAPADFTLSQNSIAADRGVLLPNINDGYAGSAPDLGALELGCPSPIYGPRPESVDESNEPFGCATAQSAPTPAPAPVPVPVPTPTPASPAAISAIAGTPQNVIVPNAYATLRARVVDASGAAVSGVNVTFTAPSAGPSGTFTGGALSAAVNTDASGIATAPAFTANSTAGSFTVTAAAAGAGNANFSLLNVSPAPAAGPPTADTVTGFVPGRLDQVLTFAYSSGGGYQNLSQVHALINSTLSPMRACWVSYNKSTNAFYLLDDSNDLFLGPLAPGSNAHLQNSQCTLDGAGSSVTGSGNTLSMNLHLTFAGSLTGTQQVFLVASDLGGKETGWINRGSFDLTAAPVAVASAPTADSVTGTANGQSHQTLTLKYSSNSGYASIVQTHLLVNTGVSATAACWIEYDRGANLFYLRNDAGTAFLQPMAAGSGGTLQNSQCVLQDAGSSISGSGNTLTVVLNLIFSSNFANTQEVFLYALDNKGKDSGWQDRGSFSSTVVTPPAPTPAPVAVPVSTPPAPVARTMSAAGGTPQSVTVQTAFTPLRVKISDASGNAVAGVIVTFSAPGSGASGTFAGNAGTATATTDSSGIATAPAFTANGSGGSYLVSATAPSLSAVSFSLTNLSAPAPANPSGPPTADAVSGMVNGQSNQTLTFTFSSPRGYATINQTFVMLNTGLRFSNTCWVIYNQQLNSITLLNDSVSGYLGPLTPGSNGSVQNSRCRIEAAGSSVTGTGNTLTLKLNLTFTPLFSGAQHIFMYASDQQNVTGWQDRGTVTLP